MLDFNGFSSKCLMAIVLSAAVPAFAGAAETVTGRLAAVWGDPAPGSAEPSKLRFWLSDAQGSSVEVAISDEVLARAGGLVAVDRERVEVVLEPAQAGGRGHRARSVRVAGVAAGSGAQAAPAAVEEAAVAGSKPWVTLACKFSDVSAEVANQAYFADMYDDGPGRLDHYWREVSYGRVDLVGSTADSWRILPNPHHYYAPTPGTGNNANLWALFRDCVAAADPFIDFSLGGTGGYEGINLMFNASLDCCAWGGAQSFTLDGVTKNWRATWNPPWAFQNVAVISHEMGHGFGLPHANNSDGDADPYDSPWDVMSSIWGHTAADPTYGHLGKHPSSYHKDLLGWLGPDDRFVVPGPGRYRVTLDPLGSASATTHRMVKVPIGDGESEFYTVEVREASGTYEAGLATGPGDRVVIVHHVSVWRTEPAWVVDADDPPANYADTEGAMWRQGEVFVDPANGVVISVVNPTETGFEVEVTLGSALFADGFESGDLAAWSAASGNP